MKNGPESWVKSILRVLLSTFAALLVAVLHFFIWLRFGPESPSEAPSLIGDMAMSLFLFTPNLILPYLAIIALYDRWLRPKAPRWPLRWLFLLAALAAFLTLMFGLDILFFNPRHHSSEIWDLFMSQYYFLIVVSLPSFLALPLIHEKSSRKMDSYDRVVSAS